MSVLIIKVYSALSQSPYNVLCTLSTVFASYLNCVGFEDCLAASYIEGQTLNASDTVQTVGGNMQSADAEKGQQQRSGCTSHMQIKRQFSKLVPCGTDCRLFTPDVSAKFKDTRHKN